jgi:ATP-dependent helicase Lhr and Lhr-like helicase
MTTSVPSGSDPEGPDPDGPEADGTAAFDRLHPAVQRWVWQKGWTELRGTQAEAIPAILSADVDVVISAATASGKTEAAFLPIISALAADPSEHKGVEVVYLSPLKALINDQRERLDALCDPLDIPVTAWHGDVPGSAKHRLMARPRGVLLITPESLEALFVLRGPQLPGLFGALRYVVVDELHSFVGTERGAQLQSLLHRVELALRRRVPRIGLSATLGDMAAATEFLRPGGGGRSRLITADDDLELRLQLRGYLATSPEPRSSPPTHDLTPDGGTPGVDGDPDWAIAHDLYRMLRGRDNLIFANSRRAVEVLADHLGQIADEHRVPNEFFAHHGNLSKDLRQDVEARLKDRDRPVNAVCTSTLEMGIDIGGVASIAQVGPPPSVATLRQRLGRSGRRGEPAALRICIAEAEIDPRTPPPDALRAQLVQTVAMVNLLLARWYEPPLTEDLHLSTLVQQLLSSLAAHGGLRPDEAYSLLCRDGTFPGLTAAEFASLLRHLGGLEILDQAGDGTLVLGRKGERLVNHYSFYAAFNTPQEWRLSSGGRQLGTLPIDFPLFPGLLVIFAGRRWRVVGIDAAHRSVDLAPSAGGRPPRFDGGVAPVHDRVRREMLAVYQDSALPAYLDPVAVDLLGEGRANFVRYQLDRSPLLEAGEDTYLFLWAGDRVAHTVALALAVDGLGVTNEGLALRARHTDPDQLAGRLRALVAGPPPDPIELAEIVANKAGEKHDGLLPPALLNRGYAARRLDPSEAWRWVRQLEL